MEIGDITYTEYSHTECERIREEYNTVRGKHEVELSHLQETASKVHDLIIDAHKGNWNTYYNLPIYQDWSELDDKIDDLTYEARDRSILITQARVDIWSKNPKISENTFYANISKYLTSVFQQELHQINILQKEADSLLYRCIHLNTKAA